MKKTKSKRNLKSASRVITEAEIARAKEMHEAKKEQEKSNFLECRAHFIKLNRMVKEIEDYRWSKRTDSSSTTQANDFSV